MHRDLHLSISDTIKLPLCTAYLISRFSAPLVFWLIVAYNAAGPLHQHDSATFLQYRILWNLYFDFQADGARIERISAPPPAPASSTSTSIVRTSSSELSHSLS